MRKLLAAAVVTAGLGLGLAGSGMVAWADAGGDTVGVEATGPERPVDAVAEPAGESPEGVEELDVGFSVAATSAKSRYGATITRAEVMRRAWYWYDLNVSYSQHRYHWDVNHGKKYRTDCSGFVSMAWALRTSRNTRNLDQVATRIGWSQLRRGDMVLRNGHVQLFHKWANSKKTSFYIVEEGSTASDMNYRRVRVAFAKSRGYHPYKYNKITGS
jgi:cell wall-associated NlpC family hydrolase